MRLLAATGVVLTVVLGTPPAADMQSAARQPVEVTMDRSSLSSVLGERVTVRWTVVNTGTGSTGPLIAHLDVVSLHNDVYVDPEDWSADRSVDVEPLAPGGRTTLEWTVRNVNAGEFDVYVVVLPTSRSSAPPPGGGALTVSPAVRLVVASRQTLDAGGSLGVVVAVPLLVGVLALGTRLRRRRHRPDGSAEARAATAEKPRR
jgi:hypothetical protein